MDLQLTDARFWRLTPRMLNALLKRRRQISLLELWPFGVLATLIANQWRDRNAKLAEAWDFFPELWTLVGAPSPTVDKTPDQLLDIVSALNLALGGKDLRRKTAVG